MYDFYKEFMGVDIAKVEQVVEIIGMVEAKLYQSMTKAGLDKKTTLAILHDIHTVIAREVLRISPTKAGNDDGSQAQ